MEFAQSPESHPTYFRGPDRPIIPGSEQDRYRNCRQDVKDCTISMMLQNFYSARLPLSDYD